MLDLRDCAKDLMRPFFVVIRMLYTERVGTWIIGDGTLMKTHELLPAERRFVYIFVATCLLIPAYWGELFPFTSAPMFRDRFSGYTKVIVRRADGEPLSPKSLRLHWNYDGNPVGFGAGRIPIPARIPFGEMPSDTDILKHVSDALDEAKIPRSGIRFEILRYGVRGDAFKLTSKKTLEMDIATP